MTGLDQSFILKESVFDQWLTSFPLQLFHSELSVLFCFLCVINRKFMVTAWRSKMKFNLQIVLLVLINHSSATPAFHDRGRILDSIIGYSQWRTRFNLCTNKRIKQKHVHILRAVLYNGTTSGTIAIIHAGSGRWMRLNCLLGHACLWCTDWHMHCSVSLSFVWLTKTLIRYMLWDCTNFSQSEGFPALCRIRPLF